MVPSGLSLFTPDRVLRDMPKPPAGLTIQADEVKVGPCPQDEVLQTPVTIMSAETLMAPPILIINRYAHALDETSKQNLQRHLQKFADAAQKSFANGVLQQDQIRFLIAITTKPKLDD